MSVALIDHVGADVIAIKRDGSEERYAVSFVFVDEMEGAKKIRVFVAELANIFRLSEIRKCDIILYYEIQFTEMLA